MHIKNKEALSSMSLSASLLMGQRIQECGKVKYSMTYRCSHLTVDHRKATILKMENIFNKKIAQTAAKTTKETVVQ